MMSKKILKKPIITISFLLIILFLFTSAPTPIYATTATKVAIDDVTTDSSWSELTKGYSASDANTFEDSGYKVNYVGRNVGNGYNYEFTAVKFDLSGISGTINSASFNFYVTGIYGSPIVNLIKPLTDDPWAEGETVSSVFPEFSAGDYILQGGGTI